MLPVYKINLPTPYPVGPVNVYLIKSKPCTLIDTGPDLPASRRALEEALASCRVALQDIERIIITHCHPDHCGLAGAIREAAGAQIFVNGVEAGRLTGERDYFKEIFPSLVKAGVPPGLIQELAVYMRARQYRQVPKSGILPLADREVLTFEDGELVVQNFPGHSQGHICLYDPQSRNFFSGDFLLPHITPNPLMEVSPETGRRLPAKKMYLDGLAHLLEMDIAEIWPGHGENIVNWQVTVDEVFRHHSDRNDTVYRLLGERGRTAYEIAVALFPRIGGFDVVLGVSEALAALDILLEDGRAKAEEEKGVLLYFKADGN
ncbi:MAG: MBL fold metallo-hydrolase [Pelotomaculum sp.]|uniref:Zn-dependent hydrolases n=1 Tax=Pelotomaculum thermopropionicum (strain DSM 13744 / JCM 10971 / SI) TaxID=370438 RepID=A5CZ26_PELTS|nr:MBL fold metallo-hydrolase [Pelotomaculum sp.]BAF60773.1 Zn-dependent hydrolases [Pelotomaculum thermopropionicum SI]